MTTNEERKEIARKLRKNADKHENMSLILNVAFSCFDFTGVSEKTVTAREAAHKIADLIEPEPERTCRIVENDEGHSSCSECGASYLCMTDASYCPDCGAKVVCNAD